MKHFCPAGEHSWHCDVPGCANVREALCDACCLPGFTQERPHVGAPVVEKRSHKSRLRIAVARACAIIEQGDQRLLALDGPCGNLPPELSLAEWRELYVILQTARDEGN